MTVQTFQGDCLEVMETIPEKSVDMILTDLPYGVLNKGNKDAQWDNVIPFDRLWKGYRRVAKDNAAIVLFGQGMFSADLMESNRGMWRYNLIWHKSDRPSGFLNAKKMPLREHEDIMVFYDVLPIYNPQMMKCDPHQRNHSRGKQDKEQTNRCYGEMGKAEDLITDEKYPRSIISVPREHRECYHPTQKPVALCEYLIRTYTDRGGVVMDSCMGSGTTGVACVNTDRSFIGIEADPVYYEMAVRRISETGTEVSDSGTIMAPKQRRLDSWGTTSNDLQEGRMQG